MSHMNLYRLMVKYTNKEHLITSIHHIAFIGKGFIVSLIVSYS
jgi:hypothetical protein